MELRLIRYAFLTIVQGCFMLCDWFSLWCVPQQQQQKKTERCEGTEKFYHMFGSTVFKSARTIGEHKAVDIWTSYLWKWKVNAILHITRLETYSYVSYLITPSCTIAEIWKYYTVKPVCNDHLYNSIYYLWLIQ